jgi:hypothetical protein
LDTRAKIVSSQSISPTGEGGTVVIGYFDPLFAANVIRLNEICDRAPITAVVADRADALLPLRARAELVAALTCVERVILCEEDASQIASRLQATRIFDEREADEQRARDLSAHIVERYRP